MAQSNQPEPAAASSDIPPPSQSESSARPRCGQTQMRLTPGINTVPGLGLPRAASASEGMCCAGRSPAHRRCVRIARCNERGGDGSARHDGCNGNATRRAAASAAAEAERRRRRAAGRCRRGCPPGRRAAARRSRPARPCGGLQEADRAQRDLGQQGWAAGPSSASGAGTLRSTGAAGCRPLGDSGLERGRNAGLGARPLGAARYRGLQSKGALRGGPWHRAAQRCAALQHSGRGSR